MADLSQILRGQTMPQFFSLNKDQDFRSYQEPKRPQSRNLFNTRPDALKSFSYSAPLNSYSQNPASFSSTLKRNEKELSKASLSNESMTDEIDYFKEQLLQQFFEKSFIVAVPLIIMSMFGWINNKICFQSILLGLSLLINQLEIIQNKTIKIFSQTLPPLTYMALFYDILTEGNHGGHYYIALANLPSLLVSIGATVNFYVLMKISFLSEQNLRSVQINQKIVETSTYFFKSYLQKLKSYYKLRYYFLVLNSVLVGLLFVYSLVNFQFTLFVETLYTVPFGVVIFGLLDIFVYGVNFLARQVPMFKLNKQFYQLQVCISLLRLKPNNNLHPQNVKIHRRCLIEIAKKLKHNTEYLQTPVKVNYAIKNYRDIFQIYASQQLQSLYTSINQTIFQIMKNNKILNSTKTIKEQALIIVRKVLAKIDNIYLLFKILSEIQSKKLVFLIMVRLSKISPIQTRIQESLNDVKQSAQKATKIHQCFEIGEKKLKQWILQFETLQKSLRNSSVEKGYINLGQTDENGWLKYKRPNLLNVQQA